MSAPRCVRCGLDAGKHRPLGLFDGDSIALAMYGCRAFVLRAPWWMRLLVWATGGRP